jgi:hypothetical protein
LGYGTETFCAFLKEFNDDESYKSLYLTCLERNVNGIGFWRKMGFLSSSKLPPKQLEEKNVKDIVIMEKVI